MGAEKLHTYVAVMGGTLRTSVWVVIWVMVVAKVGAQADGNLQAADSTAGSFTTLDGPGRFISSPTSPSLAMSTKTSGRGWFEGIERIGGKIEERPGGTKLVVKGHSYDVADDTETRPRITTSNGHTGGALMAHAGESTREGPQPPIGDLGISNGEQVSKASSDQTGNENPDSNLNGPGENKSSPAPDVDSADWATDSDQWTYSNGEWMVVPLPNPDYPSLSTPPSPAAALVMVANETVEVERNVSGLANVVLHYRFYLSDNEDPDTLPELKVYHVVEGSHNLLQEDKEQREWHERTIQVPEADISSIVFEGWRKRDDDVIALSDVRVSGVTSSRGEALDVGDEMTLTAGQPNTTESLTSTPTTKGNQTQDSPVPVEASIPTATEDQDNNTASVSSAGTQIDPSLDSTGKTSQSPAEGEVEDGNVTKMPIDPLEIEVSTDNPQNETRTSEQINSSTDIVALNSSMSEGDNATSSDSNRDSGYFNSTTTTDEEESETDEKAPTTPTVTDDESSTPENGREAVMPTAENTDNSSISSIPGVTAGSIQTNASVTVPDGSITGTSGPSINTEISGSSSTPSRAPTRTRLTDQGQAVSTNVLGTTLAAPQSSETTRNITSLSGMTIEAAAPESTSTPSPTGNSTNAVVAVPVSSTSWQVFQVFLVLCVLALLAFGFLYWKRKRRQDDEIPVFTRNTDYHNPTFSMEDATNFVSRAGRNSYKTIE